MDEQLKIYRQRLNMVKDMCKLNKITYDQLNNLDGGESLEELVYLYNIILGEIEEQKIFDEFKRIFTMFLVSFEYINVNKLKKENYEGIAVKILRAISSLTNIDEPFKFGMVIYAIDDIICEFCLNLNENDNKIIHDFCDVFNGDYNDIYQKTEKFMMRLGFGSVAINIQ